MSEQSEPINMHSLIHLKITDRTELLELSRNPELKENTPLVYIYYLENDSVNYPKGKSKIVYIGEALRTNEPSCKRFSQHLGTSLNTGGDSGSNLVLTQYFYTNQILNLLIFKVDPFMNKLIEKVLIYSHIDSYGAPPIAQGSTPKSGSNSKSISAIFSEIEDFKNTYGNAFELIQKINQLNKSEFKKHLKQYFAL